MPRQGHRGMIMEDLMGPTKIRKRGCSSSSSSSSRVYNYRLNKRAILVGKSRARVVTGQGMSRSTTPVPTWRTTPLRSAIDSPKYSKSGKSTRPVSARRLAATLWEMNEMPSPKMSESNLLMKKNASKTGFRTEKMQAGCGLHSGSGSLPPHLSDPSHSPTVSEKMDRSATGRRKTPSISQKLMSAEQNVGVVDSISNCSFMEIETRSLRPPTSSGSVISSKNRLKDVSNALTTSKELLKIINRIWAHADQPSSSMSLISALHTELERARLQVNHVIQEQRSDHKTEINYLMKCFAEEKSSWKNKEQRAIEAAIGSVASELEVERKLRRRLESLNKKLGIELAEMKSSFVKSVKELENEKRAREITEQMCDELARNIDEDRVVVEKLKRESEKVEKEREMLELADKLREERVQMKLSEAKHHFEEKNSAISKLRKQLEVFLGTKRDKDDGEVEDEGKEESTESDLHSIELNTNRSNVKGHKWGCINNEIRARNSGTLLGRRSSSYLQRSASDGLERDELVEVEKEAPRRSYNDIPRHKSSCRLGKEQSWPCRDPLQERSTGGMKSRGEGQSMRTSKW